MKKYKKLQKPSQPQPVEEIDIPLPVQSLLISKIVIDRNPRRRFDEQSLEGLAVSIQERGLQQPIIVEPGTGDTFILVSGERRLRAHKKLGKSKIRAIIREKTNHDGRERFLDAIIENDQRENMSPIELGHAYRTLWDEFDMSIRDISKRTGKGEIQIGQYLRLTDLDQEIQDLIEHGFWKDSRLVNLLLKIVDKDVRIDLAKRLFQHKVSLKGSLKAAERTIQMLATSMGKSKDLREGTPALKIVGVKEPPRRWGMLAQLGRLPAWSTVIHSAEKTCDQCPLRSIASRGTCSDCGAVHLLRSMMETAK